MTQPSATALGVLRRCISRSGQRQTQSVLRSLRELWRQVPYQTAARKISTEVGPAWTTSLDYVTPRTELLARGGVQSYDTAVRYADGSEHDVIFYKATFQNPDGTLGGLVGTFLDVTERRKAEQFREEYVSLISHDLRQPLTAITGLAELLQRTLTHRGLEREAKSADVLLKSARRMNGMIQDLVESVRLESGRLELQKKPTDLAQLVSEIVERVGSQAERARIQVEVVGTVPPALVDPERIERAVSNLVTNALKYSSPDSPVLVRLERRGGEAEVTVTDRGVGIPPDDLPYLFERFYRARTGQKSEGLGLGLYITRMLVEAHCGRIWVESEPGRGSSFHFTVPLA
ncbi:MAG: PAS domain-containing sensor histidine kinase [Chloroflexota bacterium]|nr:MAG: PAS domain-containing sensor histidine kinase [Chloroflexota bacterium]